MEQRIAREEDYPQSFLARLPKLEQELGHVFREKKYLYIALTHSSFSNERRGRILFEHNDRQEFLGDSVLSLVVSEYLFSDHKTFSEGVLTKLRASSVCAEALFEYAQEIDLGDYMLLNRGLTEAGGRRQKNILADCFEAVIAALYLDAGLNAARDMVLRFVKARIRVFLESDAVPGDDYKSLLQEKVQTSPGERVEYHLIGESGPDHHKEFSVEVRLNSNVIGQGTGKSKREAEQAAAKMALSTWFGEGE